MLNRPRDQGFSRFRMGDVSRDEKNPRPLLREFFFQGFGRFFRAEVI